jgi:hypothetical protein
MGMPSQKRTEEERREKGRRPRKREGRRDVKEEGDITQRRFSRWGVAR